MLELAYRTGSGNQNTRSESTGGFGGAEIQFSSEPLAYYSKQFPPPTTETSHGSLQRLIGPDHVGPRLLFIPLTPAMPLITQHHLSLCRVTSGCHLGRNSSLVISHWRHLRCQDRYHSLLSVWAANTPHKFRTTNSIKAAPVPANYFSASMAKLQSRIRA